MSNAPGRSEWIVPGLAQVLDLVLDAAGEQRDLTIGERDRVHETGVTAHDAGGSLSQLIEAYLAGAAELWESIFGVTEPGRAVEVGRNLRRVSEHAVAALAAGFETAQRRSIEAEEALRREVIHDLLVGGADPLELDERARFAGLDPEPVHHVVVAETATPISPTAPVHDRVRAELAARAPGRAMTTIITGGQLVVLVPADRPDQARVVLDALHGVDGHHWRCGVGRAAADLVDVHRAYAEAVEALRLARAFALDPFVSFDAVLPYRLIAADPGVAEELVAEVVAPLAGARGDLLTTLAAFVEHGGNMAAVARALSLGPRSVAYRIDRIAELTGRSPRDPQGRLTLELALLCRRLVEPTADDDG